jgi:hypothetical protein
MKGISIRSIITAIIPALCLVSLAGAEEKKENTQEGYRIEVVVDTIQTTPCIKTQQKEIRFICPKGEVIKRLEKYWYKTSVIREDDAWLTEVKHIEDYPDNMNAVLLWTCKYLTSYDPRGKEGPHGRVRNYVIELLNDKGTTVFTREFDAYHPGAAAIPFWKTELSKDGSAVYVYYRDSLDIFHVEIYERTGKLLAKATYPNEFNADMQISPDGKIFGATTFKEGIGECLFFFDVETGRTKVVKAEGEGWNAYFILSSSPIPPKSGKIRIGFDPHKNIPGGGVKTKEVVFNEIPDDLSTLFLQGGER